MIIRTSVSGGPNLAADAGPSGGGQSGPGDSQRANGDANSGAASQPEGMSATGNQTGGGANPSNVGLARVFQGGPGAGEERANGGANSDVTSQPDQAGQPKGNPRPTQSNDNVSLPTWAQQLPKKLTTDPNSVAKLAQFKSLDEFVQASLESTPNGEQLSIPGKDSTPEEVQAFYERLGKPKDAAEYSFAKDSPDFAGAALAANLTKAQAESLYRASLGQLDDARNGIKQALAQDFAATETLLQKEYGDKYDEAIVLMQRGMGINAQTGALSPVAQSLMNAGLAGKPEIVRAFIEYGRAVSEGTAPQGSGGVPQPGSIMEGRGFAYKDSYN